MVFIVILIGFFTRAMYPYIQSSHEKGNDPVGPITYIMINGCFFECDVNNF